MPSPAFSSRSALSSSSPPSAAVAARGANRHSSVRVASVDHFCKIKRRVTLIFNLEQSVLENSTILLQTQGVARVYYMYSRDLVYGTLIKNRPGSGNR